MTDDAKIAARLDRYVAPPGPQAIYLRTAKGRIHKAVLLDDRPMVDERCNVDQAPGTEEVLTHIPEDVDETAFCHRCFAEEG